MIAIRCADCHRALHAPPALVIGRYSYGPVCAQRYILKKENKAAAVRYVSHARKKRKAPPGQGDLFEGMQ